MIGGAAALHQFVRIGRAAMVGGVSGVEADVMPFGSVIGNRARLAGLNVIGLRRRGVDRARLHTIRAAFRTLFGGEGVFAQRLEAVKAQYAEDAAGDGDGRLRQRAQQARPDPDLAGAVTSGVSASAPVDGRHRDRGCRSASSPAVGPCQAGSPRRRGGRPPGVHRGAGGIRRAGRRAPFSARAGQVGGRGPHHRSAPRPLCRDIVLIGPVRRPILLHLRPDAEGARLLARIGRAAFAGDDGFLAAIVRVLGDEGFRVLGAHEILTEAVGPRGLLSRPSPMPRRGRHRPRRRGRAGAGRGGCRPGLRGAGGDRPGGRGDRGHGRHARPCRRALRRPGPGGVLVKLVKPGQDRRADLPTIGPRYDRCAAAAGLRGIAFEAGGTLFTDRAGLRGPGGRGRAVPARPGTTTRRDAMSRYLHTMIRVKDLEKSVEFYTKLMGMKELRRREVPGGKYTLCFVGYGENPDQAEIELTYNWGQDDGYEVGTGFGHLAVAFRSRAERAQRCGPAAARSRGEAGPVQHGTTVIAFVEDPDGYKIELIERDADPSLTALVGGTVRIGVTGLARAGKTAFITSLAANLLAAGAGLPTLPALSAKLAGRRLGVRLAPSGAASVPRFDEAAHLRALAADPPAWPARTGPSRCWRWS